MEGFNKGYIYFICLVSALGGLLFGYDWVVIGGAKPFYELYFGIADSVSAQGLAMTIALIGCMLGACACGWLADRIGRKRLLLASAVVFLVSSVLTGAFSAFGPFLGARFFGGVGIGIASGLSPMYIAEVAPTHIRGKLVALNQMSIVLGILAAQVANWQIAESIPAGATPAAIAASWNGQMAWRWMFWAAAVPSTAFLLLAFLIPESPRWQALHGQKAQALQTLSRMGGAAYAEQEMQAIAAAQEAARDQAGAGTLFSRPFRRVLVLGLVVAVFQQWCGTNVIFNYAQEVFQSAGYSVGDVLFNIVVTGVANVLFTFLAILTIERLGRRRLMLLGAGGLCLILAQTYYSSSLSTYTGSEVVLRANGQPIVYDGAYCLDPTHPAVKAQAAAWIRQQLAKGFRYFKLDFVTNGILEADRYHNPEVHTGVEAYNEGFAYYIKQIDKCEEPVFVDLSIAPLFPYHYANGRRQACDTWGTIGWTEYSMNAITAGWWTNGLYQYNDPDGLPMVGHGDQGSTTLAENRSRLTNGIVSGHVLLADNFSVTNISGRGNPELSRTRAASLLMNPDINEMLALDPNFRPVYGYNEHKGSSSGAESTVMMTTEQYHYVVIINYNDNFLLGTIKGTIPLEKLGIEPEDFSSVKELWMGTSENAKEGLTYSIPYRDCRLYRFTRTQPNAIEPIGPANTDTITLERQGSQLVVRSSLPIRQVTTSDLAGRTLNTTTADSYQTSMPLPRGKGMALVSVTLADGKTYTKKMKL